MPGDYKLSKATGTSAPDSVIPGEQNGKGKDWSGQADSQGKPLLGNDTIRKRAYLRERDFHAFKLSKLPEL